MKITAVVPNYNGLHLLKRNLVTLIRIFGKTDLVVVDDGSRDGSVDWLKSHYPALKIIEKVTNSGFATSVNLGVKAAEGDIIVLLNTDVVPKPDFLEALIQHFKDEKVFAVGCLDESTEKTQLVERGRGVGKFARGFLVHSRGEVNQSTTLWVNGGSGAFRKSIWEKLGGMDELFDPFYWEDIDISYRAQKSGYKIVFEPQAVVRHEHETGSIKSHYSQEIIKKIAYRNQFLFVWKNITDLNYVINHWLWFPYHLIFAIIRSDWAFVKGYFMALSVLRILMQKRTQAHKLFTKTDREVLEPFSSQI